MIFDIRPVAAPLFTKVLIFVLIVFSQPSQGQQDDSARVPARTLRVAIHVFQDDSGQGNFSRDNVHESYLYQLIQWVNDRLSNLDTLRPAVPTVFVADTRVRIRLDTICYHRDTRAWDCSSETDAPYMRDQYIDADSSLSYQQKYQTLPIFIGANNPVTGGHSRGMGDRGYIAVRGYYEKFIGQPLPFALDECGRNLVHELCHCLGLSHNFTGGPGGDQCDNCEDNGCPVEGTSNNIMDYWPSYGYALSKCQFDQIQFFLDGRSGNISEVVINDSCYRSSDIAFQVSGRDTLRIKDTVYLHQDLIIKSHAVLEVTGYLSMPGETRIVVESGGSLVIDGGTIGNLCGDLWAGIQVEEHHGVNPAFIAVIHAGMLEHARIGILAAGPVKTVIEHAEFRNCEQSVVFLPGSADSIIVKNSAFHVTTKLNHYEEGITPSCFIYSEGIPRLEVIGTSFVNEPGTFIFDADWMGTGISSDASSVHIGNSEFTNLTTALYLNSNYTESKVEISENQFINNRYGIKTDFEGIQWISNNLFIIQRFNRGCSLGIYLRHPDRFAVNLNHFKSVYGGGLLAGIVISDPAVETCPVFNNVFSNLPVAIFMDGTPNIDQALLNWANSSETTDLLKLGPQFRLNRFDSIPLRLAIVTDSVFGSAIGVPDKIQQERSIPATKWSPGGFAWYADQLPMVAFHGWNTEPQKNPDHGLYWFMNYLGITARDQEEKGPQDFSGLKVYLNGIASVEESREWFFSQDIYGALDRVSKVPATVRSAKLAENWEKYEAVDQAWLRESLAKIAENFTKEDTLLTVLGTHLAQKNLDLWANYRPFLKQKSFLPKNSDPGQDFIFPDLTAFRFTGFHEAESGLPGFFLYPNPAEDYILIQPRPGYSYEKSWEGYIISADGHYSEKFRIGSWKEQKLSVQALPSGMYIIEIFSGIQYLGSAKFVKTTQR